jgi:hypothetical protein
MAETLEQLEEQECCRLKELVQDHFMADTEVEIAETSPWLNITEWLIQFATRPIRLIHQYTL